MMKSFRTKLGAFLTTSVVLIATNVSTLSLVQARESNAKHDAPIISNMIHAMDAYVRGENFDSNSELNALEGQILALMYKHNVSPEFIENIAKKLTMENGISDEQEEVKVPTWWDGIVNPDNFNLKSRTKKIFAIEKELAKEEKKFTTPIAVHAFRFDVVDQLSDFFNDNLFCYYLVTDGVIPSGKVTNIYKNINGGESFFLDSEDRKVYPMGNEGARVPSNHLIIDYGIVKSNQSDIAELKKISGVIIDLASILYSVQNPAGSPVIMKLREQVKILTASLLDSHVNSRLVTDSLYLNNEDVMSNLGSSSHYEFSKNYSGQVWWSTWQYNLHFRVLR
jgi:hypothetical protein